MHSGKENMDKLIKEDLIKLSNDKLNAKSGVLVRENSTIEGGQISWQYPDTNDTFNADIYKSGANYQFRLFGVGGAGVAFDITDKVLYCQGLRTSVVPALDDDVCNKSYVDNASNSGILAFWDKAGTPTNASYSSPVATLTGDATYFATGAIPAAPCLRLTPAENGKSGAISWDFRTTTKLAIKFDMRVGGGNGADGMGIGLFCSAIPTNEGSNNGVKIFFNAYANRIQIYNGSTKLTEAIDTEIDNDSWSGISILFVDNRVLVKKGGITIINYFITQTIVSAGTIFGAFARTGGFNNNHYLRNLVIAEATADDLLAILA